MADLFNLVGLQNEVMQQTVTNGDASQSQAVSSSQAASPQGSAAGVGFGTSLQYDNNASAVGGQSLKQGGIVKRTFLPKVVKQKMNNIGGGGTNSKREQKCPFPIRPSTKAERSDYTMIEQSVLENERRGNFIRVYPNDQHMHSYRNFFEEERRNDNVLHNYIFNNKYKNMVIDT